MMLRRLQCARNVRNKKIKIKKNNFIRQR